MPKRVLVIGLLYCLAGILAIWDILASLAQSHLNLNLAAFLLPVGIGLIRGKPSSLWWAKVWIVLGYIGCGLLVSLAAVAPGAARANWFGQEIEGEAAAPYVIAIALAMGLLFFVVHQVLNSQKSRNYFEAGLQPAPASDNAA